MGEMVFDKLTQKVSNMLDEIGEVNILIRRLTPTQETLNRIHERVDAVLGVLKQLEKGVQLDESRLQQLEEQSNLLKDGMEAVKCTVEGLVQGFKRSSDRLSDRLDEFKVLEERRWENNGKLLAGMQAKLTDVKVVGIIVIVLELLVLSIQLFR